MRENKENEGSTSNLYTLLNPKPKDKNDNNTNIKKTDLNNVNTADRKEVVENPAEEIKEVTDEDINDINIKIKTKKSLKEKEKSNFIKPQDFEREKNNYQKDWNSKDNKPEKNTESKRHRLAEDESSAGGWSQPGGFQGYS